MIISIVNHKGGTAKTTTTVNLGAALAAQKQRVLLIDFDAQGSLSYSLGISEEEPTIADALLEEMAVNDLVIEREGMHILAARDTLADVELTLARSDDRFGHLQKVLNQLPEYDFVLIDCPPSLSLLTINALTGSDYVIVPMQMDVLSLRGLDSIMSIIDRVRPLNKRLTVLGILPVMIDPRKNLHLEISSHIRANYSTPIFGHSIRSCVKAAEAPSFGKSVMHYAPSCSTAQDYAEFAREVLEMLAVSRSQYEHIES